VNKGGGTFTLGDKVHPWGQIILLKTGRWKCPLTVLARIQPADVGDGLARVGLEEHGPPNVNKNMAIYNVVWQSGLC
jgi:hypothetical protein